MPFAEKYFTFLPTIIAGQFLSYYLAMSLDDRKKYFLEIRDNLDSKNGFLTKWNNFTQAVNEGYFNQGFSIIDLRLLSNFSKEYYSNFDTIKDNKKQALKDHLDKLIDLSRRTIDTIKHQAKTITVGAVRGGSSQLETEKRILSLENEEVKYQNNQFCNYRTIT